jgi:hypothetical protein
VNRLPDADPLALCALILRKTGQVVRWDASLNLFTTRDGDVYPAGSLEESARGMESWPDFIDEGPTYGDE